MNINSIQSTFVYVVAALKQRFIRDAAAGSLVFSKEMIDQAALQFYPTIPDDIKWRLNGRFERGVNMAKDGNVSVHTDPYRPDKKRMFRVRSSNPARGPYSYLVDLDDGYCECPDHAKGYFCKHLLACHIIEIASQLYQARLDAEREAGKPEPPAQPARMQEEAKAVTIPPLDSHSIVWAVMKQDGKMLGVEVLSIGDELVTVRALPTVVDGGKLRPQFPFEGKHCIARVPRAELFHVRVFR